MAPRRRTEDLSLTAHASQSSNDSCASLGGVDWLDLARVQRLHPAVQFRNLRLLGARVLTIFVKAIQHHTRNSGSHEDRLVENATSRVSLALFAAVAVLISEHYPHLRAACDAQVQRRKEYDSMLPHGRASTSALEVPVHQTQTRMYRM